MINKICPERLNEVERPNSIKNKILEEKLHDEKIFDIKYLASKMYKHESFLYKILVSNVKDSNHLIRFSHSDRA